jgi:ribose transport system substrate-binding protein
MRSRLLPILLVLPLLLCAGCGGGGESGADGGKQQSLRIAVVPKGTSHDFWLSVRYGAEQAARELSVDGRKIEIDWQGTNDETDKSGQKQIVETFIGNKVDGICLAPIDGDTFGPVVEQAKDRGVPVVIFDSGLADTSNIVSYIATDNLRGGRLAGERLATLVKERDKGDGVIMLRYQAGSKSTELREQGFTEAIADPKYDLLMLNDRNRVNSDATEAKRISESLLREHSDVAGVFTVCEPNNKGMLQALENESRAGEVVFVAFDTDPRIVEGLRNGSVHGVVLQDPVNMGYLAVKTMVAHLDGKSVEKEIDTGVHLATPQNMDDPEIAKLLAPAKHGD